MGKGNRQVSHQRRSDAKLDVAKALELRLKGWSYAMIGRTCGGVVKQTVAQALRPFHALLQDPAAVVAYRQNEPEILDALSMKLVSHMADDTRLAKEPPHRLAFSLDKVFNARRLLRDQSTSVVGLNANVVIRAHEQRRAALQPVERDGTAKVEVAPDDGPDAI